MNRRKEALLKKIQKEGACALLVSDPVNLFYLTGLHLSLGTLILSDRQSTLYVDMRYYENAKKESPKGIDVACIPKASFEEDLLSGDFSFVKTLLFCEDLMSFKEGVRFLSLQKKRKTLHVEATYDLLKEQRMIKEENEIDALREAAALLGKSFDFLLGELKEGISEQELKARLEIFWLQEGGEGPSFPPIVAFGDSSSIPHYTTGKRKLQKGDIVLLDIGVQKNGYQSDMTRVVFFGKPSDRLIDIYEAVKEAIDETLKIVKPGVYLEDLDEKARSVLKRLGFSEYFTHSLGHGVGLEVHEYPFFKKKEGRGIALQKGMVLTIEPGVYIPSLGGVRIEDTICITEDGFENLTNRSKEPIFI